MGLLSRLVGMLTDSRSFLSYTRHEYFRRLLCNILGGEIERIVRSETFRSNLEPLGVLPTVLTGRAFAEFQAGELAKWGKAVRDSGATAE